MIARAWAAGAAALLLAAHGPAIAQSALTYTYDEQGRLVIINTQAGTGTGYRLDAAGNRGAVTTAAAGNGAHRYWRFVFTAMAGAGANIGLNELELFETFGGPNVAGYATASSNGSVVGSQTAPKANDGFVGTTNQNYDGADHSFAVTYFSGVYLSFDFGAGNAKEIRAYSMIGYQSAFLGGNPGTWTLQYSDNGSTWTTVDTHSGFDYWYDYEIKRFTVPVYGTPFYSGSPWGSYSQWRLLLLRSASSAFSIAELEMRATPGGANQATGGTATAGQNFGGSPGPYDASKAFDGNPATLWSSTDARPDFISYTFMSAVNVSQLYMTARNDASFGQTPATFMLQGSNDGSHWTTTARLSGSWATAGQAQIFSDGHFN